ncbi:MAG: hypothetical protein JW761_03670 [Prolixibacteraceae bacterium]|nr:hypothetical protein [Prolixibacteraceae bacterium]
MKTIETENRNKKFAPGTQPVPGKFFTQKQEKIVLLILLLTLLLQPTVKVNAAKNSWQYSISSGIHSFYAPTEHLNWDNSGFAASAGVNRMLGRKQLFSLGLQAQFAQNEFQGNASSLQFLGQFTPVIFKSVELGIGTGAGYRLSGYSSESLKWNGSSWEKGKIAKGMLQVPLQISAGYRSIPVSSLSITPFVSYQLQAMFGYSPDLDPFPDSNLMFGFKFQFTTN